MLERCFKAWSLGGLKVWRQENTTCVSRRYGLFYSTSAEEWISNFTLLSQHVDWTICANINISTANRMRTGCSNKRCRSGRWETIWSCTIVMSIVFPFNHFYYTSSSMIWVLGLAFLAMGGGLSWVCLGSTPAKDTDTLLGAVSLMASIWRSFSRLIWFIFRRCLLLRFLLVFSWATCACSSRFCWNLAVNSCV